MHIVKALEYMVRGYSVIPVDPATKKPLIKWDNAQTVCANEAQIDLWDTQYPNAGIGIVTGTVSGITVVDIDVKQEQKTPLDTFPKTYTIQTPSGGYHLYYTYSDSVYTCANQFPEYPYVDIRNDGGYVVAPPTNGYVVHTAMDLQPFPAHLFKEQKKKKKGKLLTEIKEGGRNQSLTSVIGQLLASTPENRWVTDCYPAAIAINRTYTPPLPDSEVRAIFESIAQAEKRQREQSVPSPFDDISVNDRIDIQLRKNKGGVAYKDMDNVMLILQQHPLFKDSIKYNTFRHCTEFNKELLTEGQLLYIQSLIQHSLLPCVTKQTVDDAIERYAINNSYDEVIEWVQSLAWDGVERLHTWLPECAHVPNDAYHRAIGAQWLLGLMKRILYPGCVFDYVLVLSGPQGVGKTSLFRILGGDWYKSYSGGLDTKDFYLSLSGALIVDLDEGATMYKSESIKMKAMITQTVDEYRAPYARRPQRHPRRFVFSMSTNENEPFKDVTGNRRYWIVNIGSEQIDFAWLEQNREQLFAEAYFAIKNNKMYEQVPFDIAAKIQYDNLTEDPWKNTVEEFLHEDIKYCEADPSFRIKVRDIYTKALHGDIERMDRRIQLRIANILTDIGLEKTRLREDGRLTYFYVLTEKKQNELRDNPADLHEAF